MPGAGLSEGSEAGCEPCGASRYWTIALQPHPEGLGCDAGTGDGVTRRCEDLGEADRGGEDRWRWRGIRIEMVVGGIVSAGLVGVYVGGGDHWVSLKGMSTTSIVIFSSCLRPEPLRIDRFHDERLQNQSLSSISFCETASFWSKGSSSIPAFQTELIRSTPLPRAFEWLAPWDVEQAVGLYHPPLGIWWLLPEMWLQCRWIWFIAPKSSHNEQITYQRCKLWRCPTFGVWWWEWEFFDFLCC